MEIGPGDDATIPVLKFTLVAPGGAETDLGWINPPHFHMHMVLSLSNQGPAVALFRGKASASFYGVDPATVGLNAEVDGRVEQFRFPSGEFWLAHDQAMA